MLMTEQPKHIAPRRFARRTAFAIALAVTAMPLLAQAQRKSPLADAPAIRKRYELRSTRFELGAGMGTTIDQDFYHTVLVDVRAAFHITDWLSIAGFGGFAAANVATGFRDNVVGSLGNAPPLVREPTSADAAATMEKVNSILGAQLEFTPFTGKYSMFGKLFAAYDVYLFGGPGFISVSSATAPGVVLPDCSNNMRSTPAQPSDFGCMTSGLKFGANFGAGFHSYFTQWLALNIELRDVLAQLNPSGRDVNGDKVANDKDLSWVSTLVLTANLSFYLPTTASISQ
jgi:outer membrane beta-barrel protein